MVLVRIPEVMLGLSSIDVVLEVVLMGRVSIN